MERSVTMSENILELNDTNFEKEVRESARPTIIDFWAPWCGPCHMVTPLLKELSTEYSGKVTFAKFNVDDGRQVPAEFGIVSIPTVILLKGAEYDKGTGLEDLRDRSLIKPAEEVDRIIGAASKKAYEDMIRKVLD